MRTLSVIIPAYNEEKTIGDVIRRIPRDLVDITKIVVINDGSTDNTAKIARDVGADVITFIRNRGLAKAFKKGLEYSLQNNADLIVTIDADLQYAPEEIKDLLQPVLRGEADIVLGSRFKGYIESMSWLKRSGNITFTKLLRLLTKEDITDAQTGFRAFTDEVAENLDIVGEYTYTQQMIIQGSYHRFKIVEVPIKFQKRRGGKSRLMAGPMHFAYRAMEILLVVIVIYHPLKFFGFFGTLLIISGALIGLIFVNLNVLSSLIISIGILFFLFGILFKVLGSSILIQKKPKYFSDLRKKYIQP